MTVSAPVRERLRAEARVVEARLRQLVAPGRGVPPRLRRAMAHSLLGGGKRLRPVLLLWCRDAFAAGRRARVPRRAALDAACALELLHTYSLIHDDLPAMDDDVLRRGRPTCHVRFGEATAILAGDALQALAFEVLGSLGPPAAEPVRILAAAAGPAGMVGGQQLDMELEGVPLTAAAVRRIHAGKTARLIAAALACGAWLGGAGRRRVAAVEAAGIEAGLAFQAADDLLDATATTAELGKTAGKDAASGKPTWVRLGGEEAAAGRARRHGRRAGRLLTAALPAGEPAERLLALVELLWRRRR